MCDYGVWLSWCPTKFDRPIGSTLAYFISDSPRARDRNLVCRCRQNWVNFCKSLQLASIYRH